MNRLLTREADSSGVTVYSATYAYDLANNRRTIEEFVADQGTRNLAYAYDDQYRLTQEAWDTTSYDYEYDLAGNRTKLTHTVDGIPSVTDYSYDLLNQLKTATKDATSFTTYAYDPNGNQSTKTVDGSVSTYSWDTLDRLVHVDADGTTIFQADYDYRTRRLTKTEGTDVTYFRYDQGNSFQEVKNGTLDAEFIRGSGMGGGIGSILYKDDTTEDEFFVYNAVGHTVVLTDGAGVTKSSNQYEAFGGITGESGASENNRLANTKERDASTGLDNHGFRYYDSATGRYISRDPIGYGDGMNVYVYVHNNPINKVDPLGLAAQLLIVPAVIAIEKLAEVTIYVGVSAMLGHEAYSLGKEHRAADKTTAGPYTIKLGGPEGKPIPENVNTVSPQEFLQQALVKGDKTLAHEHKNEHKATGLAEEGSADGKSEGDEAKKPQAKPEKESNRKLKKRGPKGAIKHKPGRGHDEKSAKTQKKKFQRQAKAKRQAKQEQKQESQNLWDSLSKEVQKLRPDLKPKDK